MFSEPSALGLQTIYSSIVDDDLPEDGGRRVFLGDLQGCLAELESLLAEIAFDESKDVLYPLGDLVNRGPNSKGVLKLLRQLGARPILGNHDIHALGVREGTRKLSKQDTIKELVDGSAESDELLRWLAGAPLIRTFPDYYLVHAALHPSWKSEKQLRTAMRSAPRGLVFPKKQAAAKNFAKIKDIDSSDFITRTRFTNPKGAWPSKHDKCNEDGVPLDPRWSPWYEYYSPDGHRGRFVVYGHWAQFGLRKGENTLGIDTGCVWGGELTAWIPEEARIASVRAKERYAGNFRPR